MSTPAVLLLRLAAINGFLVVALGAFGAHSLKERITPDMLVIWKTGTEYHLTHALAILFVALIYDRLITSGAVKSAQRMRIAGKLFGVGIVIFSGSLYALSLTGIKVLGAITPIGGLCFLSGWLMLAFSATDKGADK